MRFWINNTKRDTPDVILTLVVVTVFSAVLKFLLDGATLTIGTYALNFGHVDSMSYAALLAPLLGAHSYLDVNNNSRKKAAKTNETT